jgi:hypothetical protein
VPAALRRRLPAALALVLIGIAGVTVRAVLDGPVAKAGGDILYAVGIYALVFLIRPRISARAAAAIAVAVCWAVEFAQLTPFPAAISRHSTLGRLALGSTFHPPDLMSYVIGVLLAWAVTRRSTSSARPDGRRPFRGRRRTETSRP